MIVVAATGNDKIAMHRFLAEHGVRLNRSEDFQAIGRLSAYTNELIGVVAYNGFCGKVCQMHVAGVGNWVSREFIHAAFDYPFRQLQLNAIFAPVEGTNERALRFEKHMGFREVYRLPSGWDVGVDLVFLEMRLEDCKWLRPIILTEREREAA